MNESLTVRQEEIIDAAGKILTESGVNGLTIKNLARLMNFSESAIYRHFKSKEEIIWMMLHQLAVSMDKRISEVIATETTADNKLKALFKSQLSFFSAHSHFVVAVFSEGLLGESRLINECVKKIMATKVKHISEIIAEGQESGLFTRKIPAAELVHIVMGSFRFNMMKWRLSGFSFDLQETGIKIMHAVLTLIKENK